MSLLHFDTETARELVRQTDQLSASIQPASATTSNNDDFAYALIDAIARTNHQASHLATFLTRVAENSARVVAHAEHQDAALARQLEVLS